jgi:DNA primase
MVKMAFCPHHRDTKPSVALYPDGPFCFSCWKRVDVAGSAAPVRVRKATWQVTEQQVRAWQRLLHDHYPHRLVWLQGRGLTLSTIEKAEIGHTGKAFVIPIRNLARKLVGVRFRRDDDLAPNLPRYWNPAGQEVHLYGLPWSHRARRLMICEGELDALRLIQEGIGAVSPTGGAMSFKPHFVSLLPWAEEVYCCYDQDQGGERGWERLKRLWPKVQRVRWTGGKDVTEFLQEHSVEEFLACLPKKKSSSSLRL